MNLNSLLSYLMPRLFSLAMKIMAICSLYLVQEMESTFSYYKQLIVYQERKYVEKCS